MKTIGVFLIALFVCGCGGSGPHESACHDKVCSEQIDCCDNSVCVLNNGSVRCKTICYFGRDCKSGVCENLEDNGVPLNFGFCE